MSYATTISTIVRERITPKGVGKHGNTHSAGEKDAIPNEGLARTQFEIPSENVSLAYLSAINRCKGESVGNYSYYMIVGDKIFTDKGIEGFGEFNYEYLIARLSEENVFYAYRGYAYNNSVKLIIYKGDRSNFTQIAITDTTRLGEVQSLNKLSCVGSEIKAYQGDMVNPKLTVSDTTVSEGYFGLRYYVSETYSTLPSFTYLRPPSSPSLKILSYFEIPITGAGAEEEPYRVVTPEEMLNKSDLKSVNKLSLSHSALIKSDKNGKPKDGIAIVRVIKDYNRPNYLKPESECLSKLRKVQGVKELNREQAIKEAKRKDDKLHDLDLLSAKELKMDIQAAKREYISWRTNVLGVKRENIEDKVMEEYVQEEKW